MRAYSYIDVSSWQQLLLSNPRLSTLNPEPQILNSRPCVAAPPALGHRSLGRSVGGWRHPSRGAPPGKSFFSFIITLMISDPKLDRRAVRIPGRIPGVCVLHASEFATTSELPTELPTHTSPHRYSGTPQRWKPLTEMRDWYFIAEQPAPAPCTLHIQKDVLPYAWCWLLCPVSAALAHPELPQARSCAASIG